MVTVTVRLFLYGLLVFVPNDGSHPNEMEVILLDATHPPNASDGCPIHKHRAELIYNSDACASGCDYEDGVCVCTLDRDDVIFPQCGIKGCSSFPGDPRCDQEELLKAIPELPGAHLQLPSHRRMRTEACLDQLMQHEIYTEQEACADPKPHAPKGPMSLLAAESHLQAMEMVAASTRLRLSGAGRVCEYSREKAELEFRPLTRGRMMKMRQQAAEIVMLPIEAKATAGANGRQFVKIWFLDFGEIRSSKVEVTATPCFVGSGGLCYDVVLANVPEGAHAPGVSGTCETHDVGRDFELFHDLLQKPMHRERRPVPHIVMPTVETHAYPDFSGAHASSANDTSCSSLLLEILKARIKRSGEGKPLCTPAKAMPPSS